MPWSCRRVGWLKTDTDPSGLAPGGGDADWPLLTAWAEQLLAGGQAFGSVLESPCRRVRT